LVAAPGHVTVVIPTFNGARYLAETIDAILTQGLPEGDELELLVIDSGSTDGTLDILRAREPAVRVVTIPNEEFGHGRTRQHAAELARGRFVVFLSQDATPAHDRWLTAMVEPFATSDKVGCVLGAQVPRAETAATIRREVSDVFARVEVGGGNFADTFFSDVNAAVRRNLLMGPVPFRDVPYAEDQALAADMRVAGYTRAYAPLGQVLHSHDLTPRAYYARKVDEHVALRETVGIGADASVRRLLVGWVRPTVKDWAFVMRDSSAPALGPTVRDVLRAPLFNVAGEAARYVAARRGAGGSDGRTR
jgi:rhamnosyltransferase